MSRRRTWKNIGLLSLACVAGCAAERDESAATPAVESELASSRIAAIRGAIAASIARGDGVAPEDSAPRAARRSIGLPPGEVGSLVRTASGIELARRSRGAREARVTLPVGAASGFTLRDAGTGLDVEVRLLGARDVGAQIAEGYVLYPGATSEGADVLHRPTSIGTEDYVRFETKPGREELRYAITLGPAVAGLRLVGRTLELLDERGTPRLRMSPPSLLDADGVERDVDVSIEGCAFDADPRGPWDRAPVPPGARTCEVRLDWGQSHSAYPILVDPSWTTTGNTVIVHTMPHMHLLQNGRAFISSDGFWSDDSSANGPYAYVNCSTNAELFDPATGTWSATAPTPVPCGVTTVLADGKVLTAGAVATGNSPPSAAVYDPVSATWSPATAPPVALFDAGLHTLADGRAIFYAGFYNDFSCGFLCPVFNKPRSWVYAPAADQWKEVSPGPNYGYNPSGRFVDAVNLPDGRALFRGAENGSANGVSWGQIFNPANDLWDVTGYTTHWTGVGRLVPLPGGKAMYIGGYRDNNMQQIPVGIAGTEIWDPVTGWSDGPPMALNRGMPTATVLADGRILVAGGFHLDCELHEQSGAWPPAPWSTEIFDPATMTWSSAGSLALDTYGAAAVRLQDGSVLKAGGTPHNGTECIGLQASIFATQVSEIYDAGGGGVGGGGSGGSGAGGTGGMTTTSPTGGRGGMTTTSSSGGAGGMTTTSSTAGEGGATSTGGAGGSTAGAGGSGDGGETGAPGGCTGDGSCSASTKSGGSQLAWWAVAAMLLGARRRRRST